ncbi:hypothetical protein BD560DRAFT_400571 [Blakeslea trispora]|nr:hypothetical protein BD560DRAFT_400571 [Blakeslea trispora]
MTHCGQFVPPLWKQRRQFIQDTLERFQVESVLDYGCGEASVLSILACPDTPFKRLAGIDIDPNVLEEAIEACTPHASDYRFPRPNPLSIDLFQGSVGLGDARLMNYEAIVSSEVIEHLYPDVLDNFLDLTLGSYQPRLMIVTTPNAEYNVYFPNLGYATAHAMFRHDDHKFEWTRAQFRAWCQAGASRYGYTVEFHGIGLLFGQQEEGHGHCTQACVFIRSDPNKENKLSETPHQLVKHIDFPYDQGQPLSQEEVLAEIQDYLQALGDEPIMDWSTFDLSSYPIPSSMPITDSASITQVSFDLESLWQIDRVQQICETKESLEWMVMKCCQLNPQFRMDHDTIYYTSSSN